MRLFQLDLDRLDEAFTLAEASIGLSDPNPRVGCVIGSDDGAVFARGNTQEAGGAHAEVAALRDAASQGRDVRGATAWVSLEPCAHQGRTGPCTDALITAGIARVVIGATDPFPAVNGAGVARLRAAGVKVDYGGPATEARCRELNIGFFHRVQTGRPWIRLKMACSLDGRTALLNGTSQWITGLEARTDGHRWRRRAGAILTGIGTVLADDPRLDVRLVHARRQPIRVVIDSQGRLPPTARILTPPGVTRVYSCANPARQVMDQMPSSVERRLVGGLSGRANLQEVVEDLGQIPVNEVHVECGPTLAGALLTDDLVDELLLYVAPVLIGPGRPTATLPVLTELGSALGFEWQESVRVGDDMRCRLRRRSASAS